MRSTTFSGKQTKMNRKDHHTFGKKHLDYPQDFSEYILWTGGSCGSHYICNTNMTFHEKSVIPTVKHGGSMMVGGCFEASGPR